jgi:predicted nucleic acid-binding protein
MVIFDANIWIALLNVEDSQHEKSLVVFESTNESILLPEYVLVETLNVLTQKAGKKIADAFLSMVFASDKIEVGFSSKNFLLRVVQSFLANDHAKLSFVDQGLLYLSQFHKVITFDKNLAKKL